MEQSHIQTSFIKNLNKQIFNTTFSIAIDPNVNIKTILNTHAYLYDEKLECANGKAIITARIGLNVLYVDTDGITNTISDSQAFSENIIDPSITNEAFINILNHTLTSSVISMDGILKVGCNISFSPILYLNLPISTNLAQDINLINKKSNLTCNIISSKINNNFIYTTLFEVKDTLNKILCSDAYFTATNTTAKNDSIYVEGKLYCRLLIEINENDEIIRKEICDTFNIATDISAENISDSTLLDLNFIVDKSKEDITTENEDGATIITIKNTIKVCGVTFNQITSEVVDDAFSCENELELNYNERDFIQTCIKHQINEKVFGEITLSEKEPAIDNIIANLNIVPEITNQYIKNEELLFEGIISSQLTYIDENKNCQHKHIEIPFVLNSKLNIDAIENIHTNINILDCRVKVKRGTIVEFEYLVEITIHSHKKEHKTLINNIVIGKAINFKNVDYQIYIAKPEETIWELCKRIKINPEKLNETNKDLPLVMQGGEKIIIKR